MRLVRTLLLTPMVLMVLCTGLYFSGYGIRVHERFSAMTTRCTYFDGIGTGFSYQIIPTHCVLLGKPQFRE